MRILYHHRIRSKDGQYVHLEEMVHALRSLGHEVEIVGPRHVEQESFGLIGTVADPDGNLVQIIQWGATPEAHKA